MLVVVLAPAWSEPTLFKGADYALGEKLIAHKKRGAVESNTRKS
jgi:hypothetical protein